MQEINRQSRRVVYYQNALDNLSSYGASLPEIPRSHEARRLKLEANLALATSLLSTLRGRAKEAISPPTRAPFKNLRRDGTPPAPS
jgi:hypothetical protein